MPKCYVISINNEILVLCVLFGLQVSKMLILKMLHFGDNSFFETIKMAISFFALKGKVPLLKIN